MAYGGHLVCESVKDFANASLLALAPDLLAETIANRARIEALEGEVARMQDDRWRLAYVIVGGEDAPGYLDSLTVEDLSLVALRNKRDIEAESERLTAQLTEARAGEDDLAKLVDRARDIFLNCSVEDGCCCGDNMKGHADPMSCGHVATDHGQYVADQWLTSSEPALASHDKRKEGRNG